MEQTTQKDSFFDRMRIKLAFSLFYKDEKVRAQYLKELREESETEKQLMQVFALGFLLFGITRYSVFVIAPLVQLFN